jgi:hypothetical protein
MKELTIDQAIEYYRTHGSQIYGKAMREALTSYAKEKHKEPLSNDSYVDALFLTDIMFQETMSSMSIMTGKCVDSFLDVLETSFKAAAQRIKNVGEGSLRFIFLDNSSIPPILKKLKREGYPIKWKLGRTAPNTKVRHFIIGDKKMLRDEKTHDELTGSSKASSIQADVYFNSPVHAELKQNYFDSIWDRLPNTKE